MQHNYVLYSSSWVNPTQGFYQNAEEDPYHDECDAWQPDSELIFVMTRLAINKMLHKLCEHDKVGLCWIHQLQKQLYMAKSLSELQTLESLIHASALDFDTTKNQDDKLE